MTSSQHILWKHTFSSSLNRMDQQNMNFITSALFGDNNAMLNAVASLLAKHQSNKEHELAQLSSQSVLINKPGKDSLLANVILGTSNNKSHIPRVGASISAESRISSFEQVHALATANLVASTQQDIVKQLAEASPSENTELEVLPVKHADKNCEQKEVLKKGKSESTRKAEKRKICRSLNDQSSTTSTDVKSLGLSEPKALVCSFEGCSRKFAWLNHLKYHELTHTNNRQFKCPEDACGKTFFTAQRLSVHQQIHTGEKPFKCLQQDCGKTFTTAGNLKNHQRIHTGEQPYVCDHLNCNRRFTEQSSLRKHKLTHSGDKPFECKICGKKFTQTGSRRQHLIRHHLDDEIRQSFKQEKDADEDDVNNEEKTNTASSCNGSLQSKSGEVNAVSCSPQDLVLNNAYPGLSTSESIVLPHGLNDHIVTVKTEVDHALSASHRLSLQHTLLPSDGLHDGVLHGKPNDLVVLSEAPMYEHDENPGDIVYTADILDHEEVTRADYVSSHIDYSGEIDHPNYSSHRDLASSDDFTHQDLAHSDSYICQGTDMSEYISEGCIQPSSNCTDSKSLSHSYLDSERDITQAEYICAEEVAVAQYSSISASSDIRCISDHVTSQFPQTALLTSMVTDHFRQGDAKLERKFSLGEATFIRHATSHPDLAYIPSSESSDHSVVVVEVADHTLGSGPGGREMHMDPMMECDEEPEKHQYLSVS